MSSIHHHGETIKRYRLQRDMTIDDLALQWPTGAVQVRYIRKIEAGEKHITDQMLLRDVSTLLTIPLWEFGLAVYNPFLPDVAHLPGHGDRLLIATLDVIEAAIEQAWYLRRSAPIPITEHSIQSLQREFTHFAHSVPAPMRLEQRFLAAYTQTQRLSAITLIEQKKYPQAMRAFLRMYRIASASGDPSLIASALMGVGTELERAGRQDEAVTVMERARSVASHGAKQVETMVLAYLARAYASQKNELSFARTIDEALQGADRLGVAYGDGTYMVFHELSGILAEKSYGLLELPDPQQTLAMESVFAQNINPQTNAWLWAWAPLDWARAYLMLKQVEESVAHGRLFFQRMQALQSPHALSRADPSSMLWKPLATRTYLRFASFMKNSTPNHESRNKELRLCKWSFLAVPARLAPPVSP